MKLKIFSLLIILLSFNVMAESIVYITDQIDIPIRSEKKFDNNIIRSVATGSKLSVLQTTEDGWTQVKFDNITGWIISRYLSNDPPARARLENLQEKNNVDSLLIIRKQGENMGLMTELRQLKEENQDLSIQVGKYKYEKEHIEKTYKNSLALEHKNQKLLAQELQLKNEIQLLKSNNTSSYDYSSRNWFIVGAIVLCFGIIFGCVIASIFNRKTY